MTRPSLSDSPPRRAIGLAVAALLVLGPALGAATPPPVMNFQGVLRDSGGNPRNGTFAMTFTFYDAPSAGNEILRDAHAAVIVSNGLFSTLLGTGTITDGSAPGTYLALDAVFRDYALVFIEIGVQGEVLAPRIQALPAPYALNASSLGGRPPGFYLDTSAAQNFKDGPLEVDGGINVAIKAYSPLGGVYGTDTAEGGDGYLGLGGYGVQGSGPLGGGTFQSPFASTQLASSGIGITAYGGTYGGQFTTGSGNGLAQLAVGNLGVYGSGAFCGDLCGGGGLFTDSVYTGLLWAAPGDTGLVARGSFQGGEFQCPGKSGLARLAYGDYGIYAQGDNPSGVEGGGAYFGNTGSGSYARLGWFTDGIKAYGPGAGGRFESGTSTAILASAGQGVYGYGTVTGGKFERVDVWAEVAHEEGGSLYTIRGSGAKSFVQNDPIDPSKVVVFAALEGDEAGTYTRGQARLEGGRATVALSPAFARVTNPDIGLTAHVSPRGVAVPLTVESLTSDTLVVRGPAGADVRFDYVVFGLRLGFERHAVIAEKTRDAPLPAEPSPEELAGLDEAVTPLGRFTAMRAALGETAPLDLTRSAAMKRAAGVIAAASPAPGALADAAPMKQDRREAHDTAREAHAVAAPASAAAAVPPGSAPVEILGTVSSGELVAADPTGAIAVSRGLPDEVLVGVAAGAPGQSFEHVAHVALAGSVALVAADASYGPIQPGDLLALSPTPGHARRADDAAGPGTRLGRALDGLEAGRGVLRVLVAPR